MISRHRRLSVNNTASAGLLTHMAPTEFTFDWLIVLQISCYTVFEIKRIVTNQSVNSQKKQLTPDLQKRLSVSKPRLENLV